MENYEELLLKINNILDSIESKKKKYCDLIDKFEIAVLNKQTVEDSEFDEITTLEELLSDSITNVIDELNKIDYEKLFAYKQDERTGYLKKASNLLEEIFNYNYTFNSLSSNYSRQQVCSLKKQLEQTDNKFISIVGIFISIFTLIIPNIALFSKESFYLFVLF